MTQRTENLKMTPRIARAAALRPHYAPATAPRKPPYVAAKAVGSFVPKLTRKVFEKHGFSAVTLVTDWARIVGIELACFTAPERLKWPRAIGSSGDAEPEGRPGATLVLNVDPARALDAEYRSRQIVERINAYFGYRAVAELRIVQAPLGEFARARLPVAGPPAKSVSAAPAAPLAGIEDATLGLALARLKAGIESRARCV